MQPLGVMERRLINRELFEKIYRMGAKTFEDNYREISQELDKDGFEHWLRKDMEKFFKD